jgi:hypothetical protein
VNLPYLGRQSGWGFDRKLHGLGERERPVAGARLIDYGASDVELLGIFCHRRLACGHVLFPRWERGSVMTSLIRRGAPAAVSDPP